MSRAGVDCVNKVPELCIWDRIIPKNPESCVCECPPREKKHDDESAVNDSSAVKDAISPKPLTIYEHRLQDVAECRYHRARFPIERGPLCPLYVPYCFDKINVTFGKPTKIGETAKDLINPPKSADQVGCESLVGHEMYKMTHKDYFPGEFISRNYCAPSYNPFVRFGGKTGCDFEGKKTKLLLQPDLNKRDPLSLTSSRFNDFSDKYSYELGRPRNPLRDSSCLPPTHVFGDPSNLGKFSLGDLLHCRDEHNLLKDKYPFRSKIVAIRNHLKRVNWNNFDTAEQAFQFFDKKKKGFIDAESLRDTLLQFNIVLTNREISELIRDCKETCLNGKESFFDSCSQCCQCRMIGLNKRQCLYHGNVPAIPCECTDSNDLLVSGSAELKTKNGGSGTSLQQNDQESSADRKKCSHDSCRRYVPECNKPSDCCKTCGRDFMNCTCDKEKMKTTDRLEGCCTPSDEPVTYEVITFEEFLHFLTFFPYISKNKGRYGDFVVGGRTGTWNDFNEFKEFIVERPAPFPGFPGRRLIKQVDKRGTDHFRTSQEVNSVFGEVDVSKIYAFGKLSDLTKSLVAEKGTSENVIELQKKLDRVKPLLSPSIFLSFGFTDEDINKSRTLEQIEQIFGSYFEILNHSQFEALYREASLESTDGMVSVERFKKVLDRKFNYGCLSLFKY